MNAFNRPYDVEHDTLAHIRNRYRLAESHFRCVASQFHSGISSALYSYGSSGMLDLDAEDYLEEITSACPRAVRWEECEDLWHMGLAVLYQRINEHVLNRDGKLGARLTSADTRRNPTLYWDTPQVWRLVHTNCEHDYYLTDSCPGCDYVEERLEDLTEAQNRAYWRIVAHRASHLSPTFVPWAPVRVLAREGLVDVHRRPVRPGGRSTWTATPSGQDAFAEGYPTVAKEEL